MNQNTTSIVVLIALVFSVAALSLSLSNALRDSPPDEGLGLRKDLDAALRDIAVMRNQMGQVENALRDSPPNEGLGLREDLDAALRDIAVMRSQMGQVEKDVAEIHLSVSQAEVCLTLIGATGLAAYEDAFRLVSRDHWKKAGCDDYIASVAE